MRNRQVGPDDAADVLASVVARITYKPGWTFRLEEISRGQGSEGLTLMIGGTNPNSQDHSKTVEFLHLFPVMPAAYDEETWVRWVLECILFVEKHEALEFFQVAGEAPYFAEHGPGRDPYAVAQIKSYDQAYAAATPWVGGPPASEHFAD